LFGCQNAPTLARAGTMQTMTVVMMGEPNMRLRAIRHALRMSQADLARAVREAGERAGEPNACTPQQVQRWERGATRVPHGRYVRALELATGQPASNLGFAEERYGLDKSALGMAGEGSWLPDAEAADSTAPLNGIWLSRYEYESSGRGKTFSSSHYTMLIQHGTKVQVRSLPGTAAGRLLMDLTLNGAVLTGNWTEETNPGGYYQGATYHGALQMLLEPSGRKMSGKWAGFGRDYEINTGPWSLELVTHDTTPEAMTSYNRPVDNEIP
jgi:transcriptional regulator with XRE-family HTH domain